MALERALKTRDIVLFNVAAIVGMRWIALAAASGPSSLFLWVLAAIVFFIPQGFAVTALSSAIPQEGGLYVWTTRAFGQRQGFLAGWLYWASNITYFPTLTLSTVVFALYVFGTRFAALEQSPMYAAGASLVLLAIALFFNIVGLKTGKWVQNIGGLAQWLPSAALLVVGLLALFRSGSATPMPAASLIPNFAALPTILFFANLCFGFAGLELAPTMADECIDPCRTFPRAITISGLSIAACYLTGTISLLWALPKSEISIISGVNQAITKAGAAQGLPWLGAPVALLMTLAGLGGIGAWLIATARLLFVGGLDRYLPPIFAKTHPRVEDALVRDGVPGGVLGDLHRRGDAGRHGQGRVLEARQRDADRLLHSVPVHVRLGDAAAPRDRRQSPGGAGSGRARRKHLLERTRIPDDAGLDRSRAGPAGRYGEPDGVVSRGVRRLLRVPRRGIRPLRARRAPPAAGGGEHSMTLAAGIKLGPYEIQAPLGAGGMGEVYRRFACSEIWLRHRRAARKDALDRAPDFLAALSSRAASRFARLLREPWSRREPS